MVVIDHLLAGRRWRGASRGSCGHISVQGRSIHSKLLGDILHRLTTQLAKHRTVVASILSLAEQLKKGTIDSVLRKDDAELAIEVLSGKLNKP